MFKKRINYNIVQKLYLFQMYECTIPHRLRNEKQKMYTLINKYINIYIILVFV